MRKMLIKASVISVQQFAQLYWGPKNQLLNFIFIKDILTFHIKIVKKIIVNMEKLG